MRIQKVFNYTTSKMNTAQNNMNDVAFKGRSRQILVHNIGHEELCPLPENKAKKNTGNCFPFYPVFVATNHKARVSGSPKFYESDNKETAVIEAITHSNDYIEGSHIKRGIGLRDVYEHKGRLSDGSVYFSDPDEKIDTNILKYSSYVVYAPGAEDAKNIESEE